MKKLTLILLFSLSLVAYKKALNQSKHSINTASNLNITQINGINDGLVAYFPINGDYRDHSGSEVICKHFGLKAASDRFGRENSACSFDGRRAYAIIFNPFDYENRTVCFWFNAESAHNMDCLFVSDNNSLKFGNTKIWLHKDEDETFLMFSKWLSGNETIQKSITLNQWHFAALSIKANHISAYLDGELAGTANNDYRHSMDGTAFTFLAANRKGTNGFFNGQMDEVKMYNRALSKKEIKEIYSLSENQTGFEAKN